jgi:hypothetical protein
VSKLKGDVAIGLIDVISNFIEEFCLKGGVSTEVGHRAHNLHLQSVFRIKYPREPDSVKILTKMIKDAVKAYTKSLKDYRIYLKPLTKSQTFALMIGYISKDEGQPHFQTRLFRISNQEIQAGRLEHSSMQATFDEDRKVINMKNFFSECFKFNKRSFSPLVVSIDFCLAYMIQSQQYCLTPDFISCYRKIDLNEANTLWDMLHQPENATVAKVRSIIFDPRTYDSRRPAPRYFMPGLVEASTSADDPDDDIDAEDSVSFSIERTGLCKATRLCKAMQATMAGAEQRKRQYVDDAEYVELPSSGPDQLCPATLEEMLKRVHEVRSRASRTQAMIATMNAEDSHPSKRQGT